MHTGIAIIYHYFNFSHCKTLSLSLPTFSAFLCSPVHFLLESAPVAVAVCRSLLVDLLLQQQQQQPREHTVAALSSLSSLLKATREERYSRDKVIKSAERQTTLADHSAFVSLSDQSLLLLLLSEWSSSRQLESLRLKSRALIHFPVVQSFVL